MIIDWKSQVLWMLFLNCSPQQCNELRWNCYRKWYVVSTLSHWGCTNLGEYINFFLAIHRPSLKQAVAATAATLGRPLADPAYTGPELDCFPSVQPQLVLNVINSTKPKTSAADFIPITLIKSCSGVFSEIICYLANLSFSQGVFPQSYKSAFITSLLKKPVFKLRLSLQLPTNI